MKYVALDIGSETIGIAVSEIEMLGIPYKTIRFTKHNHKAGFNILIDELNRLKPETLVLGYPYHTDGSISIGCKIVDKYFNKLVDLKYKVVKQDERYSTNDALELLAYSELSKKKMKEKKDQMAAMVILDSYWRNLNG
jgi:putative Holliday junction resolvase